MNKITLLLLVLLAMFSCKKKKDAATTTAPDTTQTTDPPVTQYGTPYASVVDKQDVTMYQVNMRAFGAQGNFQGVIDRLDSIKALGINVIYLMPIYPVGVLNSVNSPYCVKDYKSINTEFGTLANLRTLVDGAHSRNMSVILDWVANHTAWDNTWMDYHKDWYLQDANGNVLSPPNTNYTDVAQLNFANKDMRLEMISCMKYWVYMANVDGFRCDYADPIPIDFWTQAIDTLRNIKTHKLLMMAEGTRQANYTAGFDFNFGFSFYGQLKTVYASNASAQVIDNMNSTEFSGATNGQQIIRYLTNHDVNSSDGTPLDLFGGKPGSMALFVVVAYMKGVPMIYNGQEVGTPFKIVFPFTSQKINWALNPDVTAEYKKVIAFRNSNTTIRHGQLTSYTNSNICAFTKELNGEKILVISNLRNSNNTFTLPTALANTTWQNVMTGASQTLGTQVSMAAYSYLVLKQ